MTENLELWKKLSKTDPDQTKPITGRAGGFKGTAVKPIYIVQKMTQIFGPCGVGWTISKPEFTVVGPINDLATVHCVVEVAVKLPGTENWTAPIPGVGGDHVVSMRKSGAFVDDESFKKAYTDAVGNALKYLGVSADIHMGRFDDSKYVQQLREEKAVAVGEKRATSKAAKETKPAADMSPNKFEGDPVYDPETGEIAGLTDDDPLASLGPDEPLPPPVFKSAPALLKAIQEAPDTTELAILDESYQNAAPNFSESTREKLAGAIMKKVQELLKEPDE